MVHLWEWISYVEDHYLILMFYGLKSIIFIQITPWHFIILHSPIMHIPKPHPYPPWPKIMITTSKTIPILSTPTYPSKIVPLNIIKMNMMEIIFIFYNSKKYWKHIWLMIRNHHSQCSRILKLSLGPSVIIYLPGTKVIKATIPYLIFFHKNSHR